MINVKQIAQEYVDSLKIDDCNLTIEQAKECTRADFVAGLIKGIELTRSNHDKIVVVEATGRCNTVETIRVKLFNSYEDAANYCEENTENNPDEKYWTGCRIIFTDVEIEASRSIFT